LPSRSRSTRCCAGCAGGADAAALAAHYGSVSVVTFAVATPSWRGAGIAYESHAALWVAVMEAPGPGGGHPAGALGACAARRTAGGGTRTPWGALAHDVLFGKSVLLLLGGLVIGALAGEAGTAPIQAVFVDPFKGVLALFLLELGLVAGGRLGEVRRFGPAVLVVGAGGAAAAGAGRGADGPRAGPVHRRRRLAGHAGGQRQLHRGAHRDAHRRAAGQCGAVDHRGAGHHLPVQHRDRHPAVHRAGAEDQPVIAKHPKTLLVIVAEAALEKLLVRELRPRGAQGWTVGEVRGAGHERVREGAWEADRTIEMKIICDAEVADAIAEHVLAALCAALQRGDVLQSVAVLRPERY
jgi:nitrogen regulatory protein PII